MKVSLLTTPEFGHAFSKLLHCSAFYRQQRENVKAIAKALFAAERQHTATHSRLIDSYGERDSAGQLVHEVLKDGRTRYKINPEFASMVDRRMAAAGLQDVELPSTKLCLDCVGRLTNLTPMDEILLEDILQHTPDCPDCASATGQLPTAPKQGLRIVPPPTQGETP
jgi:hypothetical protein